MAETLTPIDTAIAQELPGGTLAAHPLDAEVRIKTGSNGELIQDGVSYIDPSDGKSNYYRLGAGEEFVLGPYGSQGEPREPYVRFRDDEMHDTYVPLLQKIRGEEGAGKTLDEIEGWSTRSERDAAGNEPEQHKYTQEDKEQNESQARDKVIAALDRNTESAVVRPGPEKAAQTQTDADKVFDGIRVRLTAEAQKTTTSWRIGKDPQTGESVKEVYSVDPAEAFISKEFENMDLSRQNIAGRNHADIIADSLVKLQTKALSPGTIDRGTKTIRNAAAHTERLLANGEIDERAASFFWTELPGLKMRLSLSYNALVRNESAAESNIDQAAYRQRLEQLKLNFAGRVQEQDSAPFQHINGNLVTQDGFETAERVYISSNPDKDPGKVLETWQQVLAENHMSESVYFKVPDFVTKRFESIVMYRTNNLPKEAYDTLVQQFVEKCDPDLLNLIDMPTGTRVSQGVFRAPEPASANKLLSYLTRGENGEYKKVSYNEMVSGMSELALRAAADSLESSGIDRRSVRPKELFAAAKPYFSQFLKMANIDPQTMTERRFAK